MKNYRIAVASERSSAYGRSFIQGIAEYTEQKPDWELSLVDDRDAKNRRKDFDGWICRTPDAGMIRFVKNCGKPTVDALCPVENTGFARIRTNAEIMGQLAADHFLSHNFTNCAFCGYRRVPFSDRRRNAFIRTLEASGLKPGIYRAPFRADNRLDEELLIGNSVLVPADESDLTKWIERLPKPIAIFCCDDQRAIHVIGVCRKLGLAVPDDVAVLGVDNDPIFCLFSQPHLSSIDPDSLRIGYEAASVLDRMLADKKYAASAPMIDVPPKGIVTRASTDTFSGVSDWLHNAITLIDQQATKGLSATDVFEHVGYSRTLVERAFKTILHTSVKKRITDVKMKEARRLLLTTSLPVRDIAKAAGFATVEYFGNAFRAAHKMSPGAWRASTPRSAAP